MPRGNSGQFGTQIKPRRHGEHREKTEKIYLTTFCLILLYEIIAVDANYASVGKYDRY
jgi:hypothetical protein